MKLKLIDISRNPVIEQKTKKTEYTLVSTFNGKTLVDLSIYRELLTKRGSASAARSGSTLSRGIPSRQTTLISLTKTRF